MFASFVYIFMYNKRERDGEKEDVSVEVLLLSIEIGYVGPRPSMKFFDINLSSTQHLSYVLECFALQSTIVLAHSQEEAVSRRDSLLFWQYI